VHILMKVETHNHPTAISPFPGAATGSGGEIRDEGATGRGAKPKAGLCGFRSPTCAFPNSPNRGSGITANRAGSSSALDIMLEGPIGAAAFNNEFGRPNLAGYFRTFEGTRPRRPAARLSQADHDRRRLGQYPRAARPQGRIAAREPPLSYWAGRRC
jgi:phosphoribosylformylglycinamidine synthase